ncbi:P2Y purinoceptor 1 [Lampris incognitus]|uniref:P2Y purinoceptor 1 n=1 Tax=Lampris incognitus TaxID=2546036 RepID=UPI0024B59FBC|nr:P2Y purinoceptor 1 [Lampris incognitus]
MQNVGLQQEICRKKSQSLFCHHSILSLPSLDTPGHLLSEKDPFHIMVFKMRNSSCVSVNFEFGQRFLPAVYISVFIIGLLSNCWGLRSLWHNWKKLGNTNIFILNLGIADILYLLTLPFLVPYYFQRSKWMFGDVFCKITRFCFNLNLYGCIGFLTCISVYRYLAIVHPMRVMGRITGIHSMFLTGMVWVLVCVQSLPDMFFTKNYAKKSKKCFDTTSEYYIEDYLKYSIGWTFTGFCIPTLITLGCYGHMIVVLYTTNTVDKVLKRRTVRLLLILIILFSVCYIPYHVLKNLNLMTRILAKRHECREWFDGVYIAHQISRGLVCLNSAINPLVYLHGNDNLHSQIRKLFQQAYQAARRPKMNSSSVGL